MPYTHCTRARRRAHVYAATLLGLMALPAPFAQAIFINEFHYDNAGADKGEGVEIAGAAGSDLSGYQIVLYNGSNGTTYRTVTLKGVLADQQNGFGAAFFDVGSLQNGGPDGLALLNPDGDVLQFISYEGAFTATEGAASGLLSDDIGVAEDGTDPAGLSLQLAGVGLGYSAFEWVLGTASYGGINADQTFDMTPVPLPATLPALSAATAILGFARRRKR